MEMQRRELLMMLAGTGCLVSGCNGDPIEMTSERVSDAVEELPTDTIERVQVSLRGFQLIAFMVGKRVVRLPHPAVRILGIAIVSSALISQLAIEYLDDELVRRETREQLTGDERSRIESQLAVVFTTQNGLEESVALGPTRYESDPHESDPRGSVAG